MSAECERIFSFSKRFISSDRNRLKDDIIEAMSCLKHWYQADEAEECTVILLDGYIYYYTNTHTTA